MKKQISTLNVNNLLLVYLPTDIELPRNLKDWPFEDADIAIQEEKVEDRQDQEIIASIFETRIV